MSKLIKVGLFTCFLFLTVVITDCSAQNSNLTPIDYENNNLYSAEVKEVSASHILVTSKEQADDIKKQLDRGASFEDLAKKYSICPSKINGGNLGFFGKGVMVPEFEKAAFDLPIGKISEPVKTQFGYHIIKVINKR